MMMMTITTKSNYLSKMADIVADNSVSNSKIAITVRIG